MTDGRLTQPATQDASSGKAQPNQKVITWTNGHLTRPATQDASSGEAKPSPKGVSLTPAEWAVLAPALSSLATAAREGRSKAPRVQLSPLRQAYVSEYAGRCSVHVREMYEQVGCVYMCL